MLSKEKTLEAISIMGELFPNATCELNHETPFQLLIAVILSAQTTDVAVNKVTPFLFEKYPTAETLAQAPVEDIMRTIKRIGLYRNKSKNIKACSQMLLDRFNGQVPQTREDLISLPGVGRKTANVVLGDAFGVPSIAVDTHVERVSKRLHFCKQKASVLEVEETLMKKIPESLWVTSHHRLIFFGRYLCLARNPKCETCPLFFLCIEGQRRIKKFRSE